MAQGSGADSQGLSLADLWFLAKMFSQLHRTVGKLQSPQLAQKLPCTYLIPLAVWCGHILVWFVVLACRGAAGAGLAFRLVCFYRNRKDGACLGWGACEWVWQCVTGVLCWGQHGWQLWGSRSWEGETGGSPQARQAVCALFVYSHQMQPWLSSLSRMLQFSFAQGSSDAQPYRNTTCWA